jgi:hypothetical protein
MRFRRILHPETVFNKRGNKLVRKLYTMSHKHIYRDTTNRFRWIVEMPDQMLHGLVMADKIFSQHLCMINAYRSISKKQIYHFTPDLINDLIRMDKNIPVDFIPDNFSTYISFPENLVKDEKDAIEGAYVITGKAQDIGFGADYAGMDPNQRVLVISCVAPHSSGVSVLSNTIVPLTADKVIDILKSVEHIDSFNFTEIVKSMDDPNSFNPDNFFTEVSDATLSKREVVFRLVVNCVVFLHKRDPDFWNTQPFATAITERQRKKLEQSDKGTDCTMPVVLVGRNYHRPKEYHVNEGTVTGHFKWARVGIDRSEIDMRWWSGHVRHYKKDVDGEDNS